MRRTDQHSLGHVSIVRLDDPAGEEVDFVVRAVPGGFSVVDGGWSRTYFMMGSMIKFREKISFQNKIPV